jgi:hypothetical protein
LFTVVDFDVAVGGESKGGVGGGLKVWNAGIEAGGSMSSQHTNRVKFSVHLRIPKGGPLRPD